MELEYQDLRFSILPGSLDVNFLYNDEYNKSYEFYKNTWSRVLNRPQRPDYFSPDSFLRQSYIIQISNSEKIIAQTTGTNFNLNNLITEDVSFFQNFRGDCVSRMKSEGISQVMSIEFSAIEREYSPRQCDGLNFYKVIFSLAIRIAKANGVDAVIGHPRRVTGTNSIISEAGCTCYEEDVHMYGVSVDLYVGEISKIKDFGKREMNLSRFLWKNKLDLTLNQNYNLREEAA